LARSTAAVPVAGQDDCNVRDIRCPSPVLNLWQLLPLLQVRLSALQGELAEKAATVRELSAQLNRVSEEAGSLQVQLGSSRQQAELLQQQLNSTKERLAHTTAGMWRCGPLRCAQD
jgi:hypothetical protein